MVHRRGVGVGATTAAVIFLASLAAPNAMADDMTAAQAGEQVGVEGTFVRVATNDEGWVVVGYRVANESVGEELMALRVGLTVTGGARTVTRDDIKLVTPDGEVLPLMTQREAEEASGSLAMLTKRDVTAGDSVDYFPAGADRPCDLRFFVLSGRRPLRAYDEVELVRQAACVGYLYFQVPGGIQLGNYNLDVKFANSIVKVPMEIMTEERAKEFTRQWKEAEKAARRNK